MKKRKKKELGEDELLAGYWLLSQGHKVSIIFDDPPDFEIDGNIGVEVTRVSQRFTDAEKGNEEYIRCRLFGDVTEIVEELNQVATGPLWEVYVEADFTSARPDASSKEIRAIVKNRKKQLREALLPYTKTESETGRENLMLHQRKHFDFDKHHGETGLLMHPHLCLQYKKEDDKNRNAGGEQSVLPWALCLELRDTNSEGSSGFYLNDVSHTEGTGILCELDSAVKFAIEKKTDKVKNLKDEFAEFWLVLVDHISPFPHSGLSSDEMETLRNRIDVPDPWSRIIVISSKKVQWHYDLYSEKS